MSNTACPAPIKPADGHQLTVRNFQVLTFLSIVSVTLMVLHDLDHLRVMMERHYAMQAGEFVTVGVAYIPALTALLLARRRSAYAALGSLLAGITVFVGFNLLHVIGTSAISQIFDPFLADWKISFAALHVDGLSWLDLGINMTWSAIVTIGSLLMLAKQVAGPPESQPL